MPAVPPGCKLVLRPEDDYNHTPDAASNYNESMYFSVFDRRERSGGWYRLGNRANEGYAEMSLCWYLPDGRVAFMASRPKITTNERMEAGGLRFEIVEPLERHRVTYRGQVCLLERPHEMADPRRAFRENPVVPARMEIEHRAASPCPGGELVREDGTPLPIDPEKGFAKAHFDQMMHGDGFFEVDGQRVEVRGAGARDKSWGPRHWQSIDWYRWMHFHQGPACSLIATVIAKSGGGHAVRGLLFADGQTHEFEGGEIASAWDERGYVRSLDLRTTVAGVDYAVHGDVLSLIPLRNRRETPDGRMLTTRITEGLTEYTCNGEKALGMAEYLDQIVDGRRSDRWEIRRTTPDRRKLRERCDTKRGRRMKLEMAMTGRDFGARGEEAARLEAQGLDCGVIFELSRDPFSGRCCSPRRERTARDRDRRGDRVRAQPDDRRADCERSADALAGTLRPGARLADQAAHREALQHAVVEPCRADVRFVSAIRAIWRMWQTGEKLDFRGQRTATR